MSCGSQASCEAFICTKQGLCRCVPPCHLQGQPSQQHHTVKRQANSAESSKGRDKGLGKCRVVRPSCAVDRRIAETKTMMAMPSQWPWKGTQCQVLSTMLAIHSPQQQSASHSRCVRSHGGHCGSPSASAAAPLCTGEAGGPGCTCPSSDSVSL